MNAAERLTTALAKGGALDPLGEHTSESASLWLATAGAPAQGQMAEIYLTSDDPDDLTLRQARLLGMADTIVHDPGVSPAILARARADAVRVPLQPDVTDMQGLTVVLRHCA